MKFFSNPSCVRSSVIVKLWRASRGVLSERGTRSAKGALGLDSALGLVMLANSEYFISMATRSETISDMWLIISCRMASFASSSLLVSDSFSSILELVFAGRIGDTISLRSGPPFSPLFVEDFGAGTNSESYDNVKSVTDNPVRSKLGLNQNVSIEP